MDKRAFVQEELDRLFRERCVRAALIGAVIFLLLAPLDFISAPELAPRFLLYRAAACIALLLLSRLAAHVSGIRALRLLVLAAVLVSAAAVELMVLDFGGDQSPYVFGMALIGVFVLGLLPAPPGFLLLVSAVVLAVYTLPLLGRGAIDHPRAFFTNGYLFAALLAVVVYVRTLHRGSLEREIGLGYEMAEEQLRLSQLIDLRAEELLLAAAEWRATFDSAGDLILLLDERDHILRTNAATARLTGRAYADLLGSPAAALFPDADLPAARNPLAAMRRTQQRAQTEFRVAAADRWFLMTAEPILISTEPILAASKAAGGAVLTVRDITDLKRLEHALTEARDDWEKTFDSIREGITIHDENFTVLRSNAAARSLLGLADAQILGRKCHELFHGADQPIAGCPSCERERTGCASTTEFHEPLLGRDLEVTVLPRPGGGIVHVVRDVTEHKAMVERIRASAAQLHLILERAPFGVFTVGADLRIEFANHGILAITGYTHEQFVGACLGDLRGCLELGMRDQILAALRGTPFRFGPAAFHCSNSRREILGTFTGLPVREGGETKVLVFVEDLTELKRAEEERQRLSTLLLQAQKMESIGTLTSGIAHDFNNVLLAVIGLTDAAVEQLPADSPARENLDAVIGAAERGSGLVRQLQAFSRQQALQTRPVDVLALIDETRKLLRHTFPKNIGFDVTQAGPVPCVLADPVQIQQVLMNLALNARDAMPQGGTLAFGTAQVTVADDDRGHPGAPPGHYVLLTVRDTGSGMSEEVRQRIFDPFFTTKEPGKGTGLGLATVYGIVSQHRGVVRVESELGRGTAFYVYLPAAPGATGPCSGAARPA